jgi:hypothetical protein
LSNLKVLKCSPCTCLLSRQKNRRSLHKKQWLWSIEVDSPTVTHELGLSTAYENGGQFSGESLMSWHSPRPMKTAIFRGVVMSRGTPRRMKMTSRYPTTKQKDRLLLQRGWFARSFVTWYRTPVEEVFSTEYPNVFSGTSELIVKQSAIS